MAELRGRALIAWLIVCLVWGSTYLAIRVGVAHVPPFYFGGSRFIIAGLVLGAIALARGARLSWDPRVLGGVALLGAFYLLGGNGGVVWAEQFVPSGLASVYVVSVTIWAALAAPCFLGSTRDRLLVLFSAHRLMEASIFEISSIDSGETYLSWSSLACS